MVAPFGRHHTSGRTFMTHVTRRTLLRGAAGTALGLAFAGPYRGFVAHAQRGFPRVAGYGDLVPVADENGGAFRLELPQGFKYRTFHHAGDDHPGRRRDPRPPRRHGDLRRPGRQDDPDPQPRDQRQHGRDGIRHPARDPSTGYDPIAKGGTISVEVDGQGNVGRGVGLAERHADELLRRPHPVGHVALVRGDGQRRRRRRRLHRDVERQAEEARLRLRGRATGRLQRQARSRRWAASPTRPPPSTRPRRRST